MKKDGETCWSAPGSERCMAVSSTDTAPALIALGASLRMQSKAGEREILLSDFYKNDGINYMLRGPGELLTEISLPEMHGWKSAYWKLRRRGSFDFPVLSVAAAARLSNTGVVEEARIVLGAVASRPLVAEAAAKSLTGRPLSKETIAEAAVLASSLAKPVNNTDFESGWRKKVTAEFVTYALRDLRGDDMTSENTSLGRHFF
jgi:CO/xanthine dehydrogenase FAD-binding subunit